MPLTINAQDSPIVSQNFGDEVKVHISQVHLPYQIGYTVHYRSPRHKKWILAGFHVDRRNAERAARRWEQRGYRTDIRVRREADHHNRWGWGRRRDR